MMPLGCWLLGALLGPLAAGGAEFNAREYGADGDGSGDDTVPLTQCFEATAKAGGGIITIPPGDYFLSGEKPVPLCSRLTVRAHGARFRMPETLGDRARLILFQGENVTDLRWEGGHFMGRVFDPSKGENPWEPNANTRPIVVTTTPGARTENLTFRDISSDGVAGAVVTVLGAQKKGSDREVETFARNVTIENCTLERSGKFMWDYGYLWQIAVWPEHHTDRERAFAAKYGRNDLVRGPLRMADGDDRIVFDNAKPLPVAQPRNEKDMARGRDAVCFFGDALPKNIIRGKQYFVVESTAEFIRIAELPLGAPIRFSGAAGPAAKLFSGLSQAFHGLYAPTGAGPGKGAIDLVGCRNAIVRGCRLSALGDTMHIQKSDGVIFSDNHITGSRMGAFFLAEFCRNATITGNTVDGSNGSRVMSVERSCTDVTIIGNTFRNGGRGSWINQPRNLVMTGNVFINNTTKGERDPRRGRRSFVTGEWESWPEIYFTTYEEGATYGPVILRDNVIVTGPEAKAAARFESGGREIVMDGNILRGATGEILVEGDAQVTFGHNLGARTK